MENRQPWDRIDGETDKAFAAFCCYLAMGSQRSTAKVGVELAKSAALIRRWSARYAWVERVSKYDTAREIELRKGREEAQNAEDIGGYRDRARESAKRLNVIVNGLMAIIARKVRDLGPDDINIKSLAPLLRSVAHAADIALNAEAQAIGADDLMRALDTLGDEPQAE